MYCIIKSGGLLFYCKWSPDEECYVEKDVTDNCLRYLSMDTILDNDVIINDIFLLINKHRDVAINIFGENIFDIIDEANSKDYIADSNLKYAELYWSYTIDKSYKDDSKSTVIYNTRPSFDAKSIDLNDFPQCIDLLPSYEYKGLPLKLVDKVEVCNDIEKSKSILADCGQFSLFNIFDGLFYELCFYGGPKQRDLLKDEININDKEGMISLDVDDQGNIIFGDPI